MYSVTSCLGSGNSNQALCHSTEQKSLSKQATRNSRSHMQAVSSHDIQAYTIVKWLLQLAQVKPRASCSLSFRCPCHLVVEASECTIP